MTNTRVWIGGTALAVVVIFAAAFAWNHWSAVEYPEQWFALASPPDMSSVPKGNSVGIDKYASRISYGVDAFMSDFPSLDINSIEGQAKFLPYTEDGGKCAIGYVIHLDAKPAPKNKIPEKYKKPYTIPKGGIPGADGIVTVLPVDEGTYEIHFVLRLLDSDGFEILKTETPRHNVRSGEKVKLQSQTVPAISADHAALAKEITLHMVVDKCYTAMDENR